MTINHLPVDDLVALGLTRTEAAVLSFVLTAEEATVSQIRAATGLTPTRTSTTLSSLTRTGLLDRVQRRRPSVVFIHAQAEAAIRQLQDEAAAHREATASRADRGAETLLVAARRSAARGRPLHEIRVSTDPISPDYDVIRRAKQAHDEVRQMSAEILTTWVPPLRCRTRLLLVIPADNADPVDLWRLRLRVEARPLQTGLEVRATTQPRAEFVVLDGDRVGFAASSNHGRVRVWSREPGHARAAIDLFEMWFGSATPVLDLPSRPPGLTPEPDYDVEEWDPDDHGVPHESDHQ